MQEQLNKDLDTIGIDDPSISTELTSFIQHISEEATANITINPRPALKDIYKNFGINIEDQNQQAYFWALHNSLSRLREIRDRLRLLRINTATDNDEQHIRHAIINAEIEHVFHGVRYTLQKIKDTTQLTDELRDAWANVVDSAPQVPAKNQQPVAKTTTRILEQRIETSIALLEQALASLDNNTTSPTAKEKSSVNPNNITAEVADSIARSAKESIIWSARNIKNTEERLFNFTRATSEDRNGNREQQIQQHTILERAAVSQRLDDLNNNRPRNSQSFNTLLPHHNLGISSDQRRANTQSLSVRDGLITGRSERSRFNREAYEAFTRDLQERITPTNYFDTPTASAGLATRHKQKTIRIPEHIWISAEQRDFLNGLSVAAAPTTDNDNNDASSNTRTLPPLPSIVLPGVAQA